MRVKGSSSSGFRKLPIGIAAFGLVWCAALQAWAQPSSVTRNTPGDDTQGTFIVIVASSPPDLGQLQAERFERVLRNHGSHVADGDDVHASYQRTVLAPAAVLSPEALASLRAKVQEASQHLALGELDAALESLRPVTALPDTARDQLHRDLGQARALFDTCVMIAYLEQRANDLAGAGAQLRHCAGAYPTLQVQQDAYPTALRALFTEATRDLQEGSTTLAVRSADGARCDVRLNGMLVGTTPLMLGARESSVRAQLECGARVSRVHRVGLRAGNNELVVDLTLDSALSVRSSRLSLGYATTDALDSLAVPHAAALAAAVGARQVVLVATDGASLLLRVVHPDGSAGALVRLPHLNVSEAEAADAVERLLRPPPDATPPPTRTAAAAARSPERARSEIGLPSAPAYTWFGAIAAPVFWTTSLVVAGLTLESRIDERVHGEISAHTASGRGLLVSGTVLPLLASVQAIVVLPRQESVPSWALGLGAAGVVVLATGAIVTATADTCHVANVRAGCDAITNDPLLGPLIMLHSLPLLAIPLTYLIGQALGGDQPSELHVAASGSGFALEGRF